MQGKTGKIINSVFSFFFLLSIFQILYNGFIINKSREIIWIFLYKIDYHRPFEKLNRINCRLGRAIDLDVKFTDMQEKGENSFYSGVWSGKKKEYETGESDYTIVVVFL